MAKKTRPSFSPTPAAQTRRETSWVYRTGADAPQPDAPQHEAQLEPAPPVPAAPAAQPAPSTHSAHYETARGIVRGHSTGCAAASLIPIPFVDLASLTVLHTAMVRALAREYGVPFEKVAAKAAIASVAGTGLSSWAARGAGRSMLKALPGIGTVAALATSPAFAAGASYAIGRIFIAHFEAGGGLHDLTAGAAAAHAKALAGEAA